MVGLSNNQPKLDLQIQIDCDKTQVKGYVITADNTDEETSMSTIHTSNFECGERIRVKEKHVALAILIQNSGSSTVFFTIKYY